MTVYIAYSAQPGIDEHIVDLFSPKAELAPLGAPGFKKHITTIVLHRGETPREAREELSTKIYSWLMDNSAVIKGISSRVSGITIYRRLELQSYNEIILSSELLGLCFKLGLGVTTCVTEKLPD